MPRQRREFTAEFKTKVSLDEVESNEALFADEGIQLPAVIIYLTGRADQRWSNRNNYTEIHWLPVSFGRPVRLKSGYSTASSSFVRFFALITAIGGTHSRKSQSSAVIG